MKKFIVKTEDGSVIADGVKARTAADAVAVVRKMYPKRLANVQLVAVEK